ncbi:MAG TPA: dienelactone hydrolase family protein [Anaerolineales bacterium]|nr:dienelactone hydrolase family protein [Anaerolineales bacterium]
MQNIHEYPKLEEKDIRLAGKRTQEGIESQLLVIQTPFGYRRVAELFRPEAEGVYAAVLYIHWYEPPNPSSNRSQFVEEANELARAGSVCLLIETLWSDYDFFLKRTQAEDMQNSIEETVNIRRAIDLLLSQPGVDPGRFALVGHDFGGMYGVLAGSLDRRPSHYVVMAATPRFPDWYLYAPRLEGETRDEFIRQFSLLDPITHIPNLAPAPILFQFGTDDFHVPVERAEEFFQTAQGPKELKWYDSGHGLNDASTADRKEWLRKNLNLK